MKVDSGSLKEYKKISSELNSMRKELDDVKEILKGLIQVIMSREENVDGEEYN